MRFSDARRPFEDARFWFQEGLHAPEPLYPFHALVFEWAVVGLNQMNSRLFVPSSLGSEVRILNVYVSPNSVTDAETIARRAELFAVRGGYYYAHWNELYDRWVEKVEAATQELREHDEPGLAPERGDPGVYQDIGQDG